MAPDFSVAYEALAQRLRDDLGDNVHEVTRKNLPAKAFRRQPALLVLESSVSKVTDEADPTPIAWRLSAMLVLYVTLSGDDTAPGDVVLGLIGKVHDALEWHEGEPPAEDFGVATTLGGKVRGAWAEDEADIGVEVQNPSQVTVLLEVTMEIDAA